MTVHHCSRAYPPWPVSVFPQPLLTRTSLWGVVQPDLHSLETDVLAACGLSAERSVLMLHVNVSNKHMQQAQGLHVPYM